MVPDTLKTDALISALNYEDLQKEADEFILDSAAAIVVNEAGQILRVTREVEEALGYLQNELLGEEIETLVPAELRSAHVGHRTDLTGVVATRQMSFGRPVKARMKNGNMRDVTISLKSKYVVDRTTGKKEMWTRAHLIFPPIVE